MMCFLPYPIISTKTRLFFNGTIFSVKLLTGLADETEPAVNTTNYTNMHLIY